MDLPPPPTPGASGFRDPAAALKDLDSESTARLLAASGDLTLVIDRAGIIRDVAVGSESLAPEPFADWIDRPFLDTVTRETRPKVEEMLADARSRTMPRWRQVNHAGVARADATGQMPVRYLALEAGSDGRVIAIGRDMREAARLQQRLLEAQQSMERDHVRLRHIEQRYRLLFELSAEAVMIVDAGTRRIVEANPRAGELVGQARPLAGQPLLALFPEAGRDAAIALMGAVASGAPVEPQRLTLASGRTVRIAASLFRQDRTAYVLMRLESDGEAPADSGAPSAGSAAPLGDLLERLPDAFAVVGADRRIVAVNPAFLELAHQPASGAVAGLPLDRFLGRPDIDLDFVFAELDRHEVIRNFETILRGRDTEEEVEVSAVTLSDGGYGFAIRPIGRRQAARAAETPAGLRSVEQLTRLVGRVSLKEIVRESTDLIERLCIEAALEFTADNRASAAEILGLSRQSLYSKLKRHGLGNLAADLN
jgi:transcriptional regulator PpsR